MTKFPLRKGIANGIATSGSALGTLTLAPLIRFMFDELDFSWTLLLIGAIQFNLCVCAMLYRPIEDNYKPIEGINEHQKLHVYLHVLYRPIEDNYKSIEGIKKQTKLCIYLHLRNHRFKSFYQIHVK